MKEMINIDLKKFEGFVFPVEKAIRGFMEHDKEHEYPCKVKIEATLTKDSSMGWCLIVDKIKEYEQ